MPCRIDCIVFDPDNGAAQRDVDKAVIMRKTGMQIGYFKRDCEPNKTHVVAHYLEVQILFQIKNMETNSMLFLIHASQTGVLKTHLVV